MGRPQHYILIIHGTFNAPEAGEIKWYQPRGAFAQELEQRLSESELHGAVWRSFSPERGFSWSGDNDHEERLIAGRALSDEIDRIAAQDPAARIHLVAHSHGGNVLLTAVHLQSIREKKRIHQFLDGALKSWSTSAGSSANLLEELPPEEASRVQGFIEKYNGMTWYQRLANTLTYLKERTSLMQTLQATRRFNSVGRLVFVGTPFLRKQWLNAGGSLMRAVSRPLRNLMAVPMLIVLSYTVVLMYAALASLHPSIPFIGPDPRDWPGWVQWTGGGLLLLSAVALFEEKRYNTNLYFDEREDKDRPTLARYSALVISARYLDEALLALSSEPIVFSHIVPQIDALLGITPAKRITTSVGIDQNIVAEVYSRTPRKVVSGALRLIYWVCFPFWAIIRSVARYLLVRLIVDAANAAAVGVPPAEVKGSRISVSFELGISECFSEINRDVSTLAFDRPLMRESSRANAQRYAFLTDETALADRKAALEAMTSPNSWRRIKAILPRLYARYTDALSLDPPRGARKVSAAQYENEIARVWFIMSERLHETSGAIELVHGLYYSNPDVIDMVGRFLVTGNPDSGRAAAADRR